MEGLDQRLRQREARGLDQDVLRRLGTGEQRLEGRNEIVRHRAADAAVRQLDDGVLCATLDAAGGQERLVEADITELVDQDGEAPALRVLDHVADQRRLAGAEEARDDGAGDLGDNRHSAASRVPAGIGRGAGKGGIRAITPFLNSVGRSRHGTMPSGVAA